MRITYRNANNKEYWTKRWADIPVDKPMSNHDVYPLKYAEMAVKDKAGKILEAGCGAGRILRYYHEQGYNIVGMDFIAGVIERLKQFDSTLKVGVEDITKLTYSDGMFKYVLAYGLYHNLENGLNEAMRETYRVLEKGGKVCASFRADNLQTRLTDLLTEYREWRSDSVKGNREFHKRNLTRSELIHLFERTGFKIQSFHAAENMPILYKFSFFRHKTHKVFDENKARKEGYKLSFVGRIINAFLLRFFPNQFCNVYVIIAEK